MGDSIMTLVDNILLLLYIVWTIRKITHTTVLGIGMLTNKDSYVAMTLLELVFVLYLVVRTAMS